jgi:hypothetical protein
MNLKKLKNKLKTQLKKKKSQVKPKYGNESTERTRKEEEMNIDAGLS